MDQILSIDQRAKLELRQFISPNIIQSLEILQYNILELSQRIEAELQENPILELLSEDEDVSDKNEKEIESEDNNLNEEDDLNFEMTPEDLELYYDDGTDIGYFNSNNINYSDNTNAGEIIEKLLTYEKNIQEDLIDQISFLSLNDVEKVIALTIISAINDKGHFVDTESNIAHYLKVDVNQVRKILKLIQSLEPPGIAAKDARESLLNQLERKKLKNSLPYEIINDYFDYYITKKFDQIKKGLNINNTKLINADEIIKSLNPYPAQKFGEISNDIYIYPDVTVKKFDNRWIIIINDEYIPKLKINRELYRHYKSFNDPKTSEFINKKYQSAIWIIKSINQRNNTLYKITNEILNCQKIFFDSGNINDLKPMMIKQIASKLEISPSTVSRALSNKFLETPLGVYKFRKLFSTGVKTQVYKSDVSRNSIIEHIKELVNKEDKIKPLTDTAMWKILTSKGFQVKRRTVAKYRTEAGILSKHHRKVIK